MFYNFPNNCWDSITRIFEITQIMVKSSGRVAVNIEDALEVLGLIPVSGLG